MGVQQPLPSPRSVTIDVEVRYAETDQMGVVHHANYLIWFEQARTRLCTLTGYHYADIEELGYLLMVSGVHLSYRGGARYGDEVQVEAWVERLASRVIHFGYRVRRDDEILVTGTTEHAWVDRASGRNCRIPEQLRRPFLELAGKDSLIGPR